jgi:hypothetical protein
MEEPVEPRVVSGRSSACRTTLDVVCSHAPVGEQGLFIYGASSHRSDVGVRRPFRNLIHGDWLGRLRQGD